MKLFRTQKRTKQPPSSSSAPGTSSLDSPNPKGPDDLASRIDPYTSGYQLQGEESYSNLEHWNASNSTVTSRLPQPDIDLTPQGATYRNGSIDDPQVQVPQEGSIHSQQEKGWTRGFFGGATTSKEKEANAELMRMIGLLMTDAPVDQNLVLEVCERASANESAAKEVARALRREFKSGEPSVQLNAARLWAIMLQNATDTFILQTASRKFLENLEEVTNSETTSPVVRERLLDVLGSATYVHGKDPGKERFASTWKKIRPSWKPSIGVPFDPKDGFLETEFPRGVASVAGGDVLGTNVAQAMEVGAAGTGIHQARPQQQSNAVYRVETANQNRITQDLDSDVRLARPAQQRTYEELPPPYRASLTRGVPGRSNREIIPPEEDTFWLMQECDVAQINAQVLSQALLFATPNTFGSDVIIQEFHSKCRTSQDLIVEQIPWASTVTEAQRAASALNSNESVLLSSTTNLTKEEKLLAALLAANQELVDVFRIYDQLKKLAFEEMQETEITERSKVENWLDRTRTSRLSLDKSSFLEPPASQDASSSLSASMISISLAPPAMGKQPRRNLPRPPNLSADQYSMMGNNPSTMPSSSTGSQKLQLLSQQPSGSIWPLVPQHQQQTSSQAIIQQRHQEYPVSNELFGGGGYATRNLPITNSQDPHLSTGPADTMTFHTPSLDMQGDDTPSHTLPIIKQTQVMPKPTESSSLPHSFQNSDARDSNELVSTAATDEGLLTGLLMVNQELNPALPGVGEKETSVYISETTKAYLDTTVDNRRDDDGEYNSDGEIEKKANHSLAIPPTEQVEILYSLEKLMKLRAPEDLTGQVNITNHRDPAQGGHADVFAGLMGDKRVSPLKSSESERATEATLIGKPLMSGEMRVWAALEHPNISEFLGYAIDFGDYPAMISTWCQHGTVSQYLDQKELSVDHRLRLSLDVGNGLQYLHKLKLIHGDLKPSNVLVDDDFVARLCDFGLVRMVEWDGPAGMTTTSPYTGTERYKASELFVSAENRRPIATFEGDIYSLGCVLLEIIERNYPFKRFKRTYELRDAIMDGHPPALRTESSKPLLEATEYLWNLLESCWTEPSSRPDVHKVVDALEYFMGCV